LHQAEGVLYIQIIHLRACLSENQEVLILALKGIGDDEVFDAGLFGSTLERKHIRLFFLIPFCLLVQALVYLFTPIKLSIALVKVFEGDLRFW
jgi:hypothetical protein